VKADREKLVQELKAWRLNQPYMTSEEFQAQTERIQRNVRARWPKPPDANGKLSLNGGTATEKSSTAVISSPA